MLGGILSMILFNVADTFFVGQLGTRQLAAISFTFPVVMVLISLAIGLGSGTSSVLARAIGSGDREYVRRLTSDAMLLAFVIVGILALLGIATIDPLFRALGASDELLPLLRDYMEIWYLGMVFLVVPMVGMAGIRATGDARLPGLMMISTSLLNVALDPILIFGLFGMPRLELQGAALASVIARTLTFVVSLSVLHFRLRMLSFRWLGMAAMLRSWRAVLHVGLPAAGTQVIIPVSNGLIIAMIAPFGLEAVAGFGVATRIEAVAMVAFFAISAIIGPFMGQNMGAGRWDRNRQAVRLLGRFCLVWGGAMALLLALVGSDLARLFNDAPAIVAVAGAYLSMVPISYAAYGFAMIAIAAFNGLGRPLPAVGISTLRVFVVYLPLALLGRWLFGVEGIFAAALLANLGVGFGSYLWIRRACGSGSLGSKK